MKLLGLQLPDLPKRSLRDKVRRDVARPASAGRVRGRASFNLRDRLLLVGGALGNVIDRVFYGAVADFLNMSLPNWRNPYSFNVADIAIFAGAIGLILVPPQGSDANRDKTRDAPAKSG